MATTAPNNAGWLRNPGFDLMFIAGIAAVAVASGLLVNWNNELFLPILAADLWILGYHHVISTYTRLAFDKQSFAEHKHLIVYLFPAVASAVLLLALTTGIWLIATVYLYWQWWHYTRQSEGISKAYAGKSKGCYFGAAWLVRATFWSVPVTAILAVSARSPEEFLFFPLRTLPVAEVLVNVSAAVSGGLLLLWAFSQLKAWRSGKLAVPYVLYVLSHHLIYFLAYIYMTKLDYGWLIINIWHNAQYILFVWLFNNRRFGGKTSAAHPFLSTISQNGRFVLYIATCLTLSTLVYFLLGNYIEPAVSSVFAVSATMTTLIIYQTINFHHYIVDSLIWKLRRKPLRSNLGIS